MLNIQKQLICLWHSFGRDREQQEGLSPKFMERYDSAHFSCSLVHQLLLIFFRVSVESDIWEICLTSAWLSTNLESFAHRPIANAGKNFCKHGPNFSFIIKYKVRAGFEFCTNISHKTNLQFFQMGSVSMASCLLF
jgi:hypothetical protein